MTVKMMHPGKQFTADVHPEEVDNFKAGGWRLIEDDSEAPKRRSRKPKVEDDDGTDG